MVTLDEARYEQLIAAETMLNILHNMATTRQFIGKSDIIGTFGWGNPGQEPDYPFDEEVASND